MTSSFPFQRMVVIGTTSSGKSTLAKRLSERLGLDFIELDALYWRENWTPATPEAFQQSAQQNEGSWWTDWQAWIDALNRGEKIPARTPGDGKLKPIEDGPGSYVALRLGDNGPASSAKS